MKPFPRWSLLCALLLAKVAAGADTSMLIGTVIDGERQKPLPGVMVFVSAPELEGERIAVTDEWGNYRVSALPAGTYSLRFDKDGYKADAHAGLRIRQNGTVRHDMRLSSASSSRCDNSTATSVAAGPVQQEFIRRIAVQRPRRSPRPTCPETRDVTAATPSWMLARKPVLVANGSPQLVYRAPSADRCSPDFGFARR